jgi:hypothetical protein
MRKVVQMLYPGAGWVYGERSYKRTKEIYSWANNLPENPLGYGDKIKWITQEYGIWYMTKLDDVVYVPVYHEIIDLVSRILMNKGKRYDMKGKEVVWIKSVGRSAFIMEHLDYGRKVKFMTTEGNYSDTTSVEDVEKLVDTVVELKKEYIVKNLGKVVAVAYDFDRNEAIVATNVMLNNRWSVRLSDMKESPVQVKLSPGKKYCMKLEGGREYSFYVMEERGELVHVIDSGLNVRTIDSVQIIGSIISMFPILDTLREINEI